MVSLRRDLSVRTRMTLLSCVVMTLLCTALSGVILMSAHGHATDDRSDRILLADVHTVRQILRDPLPSVLPDHRIAVLQVVAPDGRIVAANARMLGHPRVASFTPRGQSVRADQIICDLPRFPHRCLMVVAVKIDRPGGEWLIYGADPVVAWYVDLSLLAALLLGSMLLIGATAIGAYRTVSRTLDPVDAISAELAEIASTDLGRRVPVPEHRDEIWTLADTANRTLARLEATVEQQRRFASDASHDLRSPLTAIRTQVEESLLHPDQAHWPATARAVLAGVDRLEAIVSDLLTLARLESGAGRADDRLDLSELAGSELARRAPLTGVEADLRPGVLVRGDRLELARLLTNLVDNAARHATSTVTVSVRREGDTAVLEVTDDGPGIPPGQREIVFQRFARLDAARSKDKGGTGLGLAIARESARRHGGELNVEDSASGARLVLRIPLAS
ncbi:HAMP domain-containing histidine kinase [Nonomuraea glycinis]|uniref:histidine kinase n=1 Tax=Nonomuraea glycinis TaxID=2047744 RepID=A0A918E5C0_9ACTN|nr:HAMP domain-containing sensor histidine kinase [Nonomuraea glycinis]MCA2178085.1 HAMP domain-containing histidine kinase [Nonomuraea glycinis]GGP06117.1 two-component sensor histidine kinase [Nonomuraea glycinis]